MKLVLDNGREYDIRTQTDAICAVRYALREEELPKDSPCNACAKPMEECDDSCEWFDHAELGSWSFKSSAAIKREYDKAKQIGCLASPFRYSKKWESFIVPGRWIPYVEGNDLYDLLDEWEMYACFLYDFRWADKITARDTEHGFEHVHSFDSVIRCVLHDPVNFYIPECVLDQYSAQEIRLLELVRARLCADMKCAPKAKIVDVLDEKDERCDAESGEPETGFDVAVQRRIDELENSVKTNCPDDEKAV